MATDRSPDSETHVEVAVVDSGRDRSEQLAAEARRSAIEAGRRKGGVAGAAMAGAMLAVADIVDGPPRDLGDVTVEAPGEPGDIDVDGIELSVGATEVAAPPLERIDPPQVDARRRPKL